MRQKHVLAIGGRNSTVDKLEKLGLRFSMVQIPEMVDARQYNSAERYAVLDYENLEELLALSRAWHRIDPFDAIFTFTEYGLENTSRCAIDLGIAGDNLAAVLVTRDKTKTRALLNEHGLSPVRHRVCSTVEDARAFFAELGGEPIVLKPCDGGLSEGVFIVETEAELAQRWAWSSAARPGPVLAEEFLRGHEFSVESLSLDGVHEIAMITEKVTTPLPRFVELGHQAPARLSDADRTRIVELVTTFLDLIGQRTGPAHTEIRLTPSGPKLIESQTRVGGDQVWELCEMVSGIDMMAEAIAALADVPPPQRIPVASAAAIRFFGYENIRVLKVSDLHDAEHARGVVRVHCDLAAGQEIGPLSSSYARQGYVLSTGDSVEDAVGNAEAARDLVRVDWESLANTSE
ncbi:ATP-grasp domain-containing protein [Nocardia sp. NBC_01499]|uniref:ATP-grasp domain-containing protein n=1 Tax=Nocardia sp. NBC_01499 TaxID=2903597 RepID=UPI00386C9CEE